MRVIVGVDGRRRVAVNGDHHIVCRIDVDILTGARRHEGAITLKPPLVAISFKPFEDAVASLIQFSGSIDFPRRHTAVLNEDGAI